MKVMNRQMPIQSTMFQYVFHFSYVSSPFPCSRYIWKKWSLKLQSSPSLCFFCKSAELSHLTDPFTMSKPQIPSIDVSVLHKSRWSADYEALKLWKVSRVAGCISGRGSMYAQGLRDEDRERRRRSHWVVKTDKKFINRLSFRIC